MVSGIAAIKLAIDSVLTLVAAVYVGVVVLLIVPGAAARGPASGTERCALPVELPPFRWSTVSSSGTLRATVARPPPVTASAIWAGSTGETDGTWRSP
jgi:hypothetical protein